MRKEGLSPGARADAERPPGSRERRAFDLSVLCRTVLVPDFHVIEPLEAHDAEVSAGLVRSGWQADVVGEHVDDSDELVGPSEAAEIVDDLLVCHA